MNAADFASPALSRPRARPKIALQALVPLAITAASSVQFCILAWISFTEVARNALMGDFGLYYQAFYVISNGHLDGFESIAGLPFVKIHANFLMWPLAAIGALSSTPLTLKLISDAAAALATLVGLGWAREIVEREGETNARTEGAILAACIAVAVLNPWTYQSNAFDFHFYAISALAAVGLGRALYNGSPGPACAWMLLGVLAGDVSTTIVTATAFGLAIALPYARQTGFALAAAGAVAFGAVELQGFAVGDQLAKNFPYVHVAHGAPNAFAVLSWLLAHPVFVGAKIAAHADALYANLSPSGFIGIICPFTALPTALILFENVMTTDVHDFIWPGNETAPVYYLMLPGLAWALARIARTRLTTLVVPLCLLVAANCAGWNFVWFPLVESQWLRVSPAASTAVGALHEKLGDKDEVIASDRFVGSLADREEAYSFHGGKRFPIRTRTYVTLSAHDGTSPNAWAQAYGGIAALLDRPDARLISVTRGVWTFEFPRASNRSFAPPATVASLPAAVFEGDVGRRDLARKTIESDGRAGYLVRDATWRDPPGQYAARITASGPVTVEAWDASRGTLLARKSFASSGQALMPFTLPSRNGNSYYSGAWIFRCGRQVNGDGDDWIELRVATAGGAQTRVDTVALDGDQGLVPNF
jgi:hypothetical protein